MKQTHWVKNKLKVDALLVGVVIVPMLLIFLYLIIFAQPRYLSAASVIVKQQNDASPSMTLGSLGSLLGGTSTSTEDARLLETYILSSDMLEYLDGSIGLKKMFVGQGFDPVFHLDAKASKEKFLKYYQSHIEVTMDDKTSMLNINAEAFSPEQAQLLNRSILKQSETFINDISHQLAQQHLFYAEQQLKEATIRLNKAKQDVLNFQNNNQILDPKANAEAISGLIAGLQAKLAELQTLERTQLSYLNPDAPQMVALHSQIIALQQQITNEQSKLTSPNAGKLNQKAMQFETIKAAAIYSEDLYKISLSALEKARIDSFRNVKNLVVISNAQLPEDPVFPRYGYLLLTALLVLLLVYALIKLTLSVIKDHQD